VALFAALGNLDYGLLAEAQPVARAEPAQRQAADDDVFRKDPRPVRESAVAEERVCRFPLKEADLPCAAPLGVCITAQAVVLHQLGLLDG